MSEQSPLIPEAAKRTPQDELVDKIGSIEVISGTGFNMRVLLVIRQINLARERLADIDNEVAPIISDVIASGAWNDHDFGKSNRFNLEEAAASEDYVRRAVRQAVRYLDGSEIEYREAGQPTMITHRVEDAYLVGITDFGSEVLDDFIINPDQLEIAGN